MNEIEAKIALPSGAQKAEKYARYYASGPNNDVLAVYTLPEMLLKQERESCEEAETDGHTHPVPCSSLMREGAPKLKPGARYWLKDMNNLPWISDPDCKTVAFVFNTITKQFTELRCLGADSDPYVIRDS